MSTKGTEHCRRTLGSQRTIEEAVSYAIGHRIRIEMLAILNEESRGADELARMVRQPLNKVVYHINELLDSGSIEIVKTEKVRNLDRNLYRAVTHSHVSHEEIAAKTDAEKQQVYGRILQASMAEALASLWAGKIAGDPCASLTWGWFEVDAQGRIEIAAEQAAHRQRIRDIEARSSLRRGQADDHATSVVVASLGFQRSRAPGDCHSNSSSLKGRNHRETGV